MTMFGRVPPVSEVLVGFDMSNVLMQGTFVDQIKFHIRGMTIGYLATL